MLYIAFGCLVGVAFLPEMVGAIVVLSYVGWRTEETEASRCLGSIARRRGIAALIGLVVFGATVPVIASECDRLVSSGSIAPTSVLYLLTWTAALMWYFAEVYSRWTGPLLWRIGMRVRRQGANEGYRYLRSTQTRAVQPTGGGRFVRTMAIVVLWIGRLLLVALLALWVIEATGMKP